MFFLFLAESLVIVSNISPPDSFLIHFLICFRIVKEKVKILAKNYDFLKVNIKRIMLI